MLDPHHYWRILFLASLAGARNVPLGDWRVVRIQIKHIGRILSDEFMNLLARCIRRQLAVAVADIVAVLDALLDRELCGFCATPLASPYFCFAARLQ